MVSKENRLGPAPRLPGASGSNIRNGQDFIAPPAAGAESGLSQPAYQTSTGLAPPATGTDPALSTQGCFGLSGSHLRVPWLDGRFREKKLDVIRHGTIIQNGGYILENIITDQASNAAPLLPDGSELVNAAPSDQNPTIFTQENLEKAIKLLDRGSDLVMRIRQGRRSTGKLPDHREIDMRPFKMEEKEERQPFLKEIMTLCRVKHLNVVKLLGCCLETKPDQWLVYEYVSDLTLYNYLHANANPETQLQWKDLLKIAKGTARALADFHAISVWHRDVRSSNILLDENGNPKVVEFGVARVLSSMSYVNQTIGYLDPEYTHTKQLTEKSDVYSFGVVLVELLTGQDPNSDESKKKGGSLTMHFISEMNENRLQFLVQDGLPVEAGMDQLQELAKLAEDCLKLSGNERPTMKEVMGRLRLIGDGDEQGADGAPEQGGEGEQENGEDGNGLDLGREIYSNVQETVRGEGSSMIGGTFTQSITQIFE